MTLYYNKSDYVLNNSQMRTKIVKLPKLTKTSSPGEPKMINVGIMITSTLLDLHPAGIEVNTYWITSAVMVKPACSAVIVKQSRPMRETDIPVGLHSYVVPIMTGDKLATSIRGY